MSRHLNSLKPTCTLLIALPAIAFTGCIGPSGKKLATHARDTVDLELPSLAGIEQTLFETKHAASDSTQWWQKFEDPTLDRLVAIAHEKSRDIKLGLTRLAEAQSGIRNARAAILPSIDFQASHQVNESDVETNNFQRDTLLHTSDLRFNLGWQVDVFGRAKASIRGERQAVASSEALLRDLRRIVTSQVVTSYFQLRSIQAQLQLTHDSEKRRAENLERIDSLLSKGYATALDISRTESQLYQSRATLSSLQATETQLTNQIALLTGLNLGEAREILAPGSLATPPENAPPPSIEQFLYNRPDIRAAEHDLLSNAFRLNAAKASLYPSLSLASDIGSEASDIGTLPSLERISSNLIANLAVPIIGRGRLLAAIDSQSAILSAAQLRYEQAIVSALAEIDTSLVALDKNQEILRQRILESKSATRAAELSHKLFLAGELDYTSVIVAEQTRANAEINLVAAQRDALLSWVNYISAIAPIW